MNLNKLNNIEIYGDINYRGDCPAEGVEQTTAIGRIRREYPQSLGLLVLHPRNEGKRRFSQAAKEKAQGLTPGASDIVIPANPAFVCEIKRRDHTKSTITPEQIRYLNAAQSAGCFACVALGADAVMLAIYDFMAIHAVSFPRQ
mgnify:CR=1 FL=1